MASITITLAGVTRTITDVGPYRAELIEATGKLATIYAEFDETRPERLLPREEEIVELVNRAEELRVIVETWDARAAATENVLVGWMLSGS